jgi:pimeloyl-ACP methyl ester carboxylesterase
MKIENITTGTDPNLTLVMVVDSEGTEELIKSSLEVLAGYTVWIAACDCSVPTVMFEQADKLLAELDRTGFKRSSLVAFDRATAVAQIALARNAQIVRRAVFVNPQSREQPSWFHKLAERWQRSWALPLPFMLDRDFFDIRYLYHRVACPLLIVKTGEASELAAESCEGLSDRAPNSWLVSVPTIKTTEAPAKLERRFIDMIREFIEVPSKRSQKNLGGIKNDPPTTPETDVQRKAA